MMDQQMGASLVVDQFNAEDFGAPFKIVLHDCVTVSKDEKGEIASYKIPDLEGLMRVVVLSRILNARKLSGGDIKFLRKAVCVKQKDMARAIEMEAATLSRYEADAKTIGAASEKLLRLFLFKTVIKHHKIKDCEAKTKLEAALDSLFDVLKPVPVYDADEELVLHFHRSSKSTAGNDNDPVDEESWKDQVTG